MTSQARTPHPQRTITTPSWAVLRPRLTRQSAWLGAAMAGLTVLGGDFAWPTEQPWAITGALTLVGLGWGLGVAYGLGISQLAQRLLPPLHTLSLAGAALRLAGLHLAALLLLAPPLVWVWGQATAQQGLPGSLAFGLVLVTLVLTLGQALASRVSLALPRKPR